jgi:hypothetical protein
MTELALVLVSGMLVGGALGICIGYKLVQKAIEQSIQVAEEADR